MLKFVVLAILLTSALAQEVIQDGIGGDPLIPPHPGCLRMINADGKSLILCNGTAGVPGPTGPTGPKGIPCENRCCNGCQGPVGNPGRVANPYTSNWNIAGEPTPTEIQNRFTSWIGSMVSEILWLPVRLAQAAINTAYEVVVRAAAYFVQSIFNMAALALVTWLAAKYFPKMKQAPAMAANDYFANMQGGQRMA